MNTLFTSANSPEVMAYIKPKPEESDVSQVSSVSVRKPERREAESTESMTVTSLKTSSENGTLSCHHYCAMRNGICFLEVLSLHHWASR